MSTDTQPFQPQPPTPGRANIPADLIVYGASISIPLHVINVSGDKAEYKVGIMVAAADAAGNAQAARMYEFDTGGQGFWMDARPGLPLPTPEQCTLSITYTSGITYQAAPTPLTLTFTEAQVPPDAMLTADIVVGLVRGILPPSPNEVPRSFPIYGNFWGDFGAALKGFGATLESGPALLTALAQLPAPYNTGFIVDVGPYPSKGNTATPRVIVGLTDALRSYFPNVRKMTPSTPYANPQGTSFNTFQEDVIPGTLFVNDPSPAAVSGLTAVNIGVVFDTGAPTTTLHKGTEVKDDFQPKQGDQLALQPMPILGPPTFSILDYTVGADKGLNAVEWNTKDLLDLTAGYINTGLNPFFQSQIMFDLEKGVIGFPATA